MRMLISYILSTYALLYKHAYVDHEEMFVADRAGNFELRRKRFVE